MERIYAEPSLYDELLPEYVFGGQTDEELLDAELTDICDGRAGRPVKALEIGPGTGRMTTVLMRHADHGTCIEASPGMAARLRQAHPECDVTCQDIRAFVGGGSNGAPGPTGFQLVLSCWSLNYPLLDCFESNDGNLITSRDPDEGNRNATVLIDGVAGLLGPGGSLLALFFDAQSEEQQFVTEVWTRILPFPGTGRGYTRELLIDRLAKLQENGQGVLHHHHEAGEVVFRRAGQAEAWFNEGHFKGFPALSNDEGVQAQLTTFIAKHRVADAEWRIGAGVHVIRFTSARP